MKEGIKKVWRFAYKNLYDWFIFEQWQIYIRHNKDLISNENICGFKNIPTPNGHFYADPFIFKKHGKIYLFYEDYDIIKDKGNISCMEITDKGKTVNKFKIIEKDYHLSFPHIFEFNNEIYMIPETSEANRIELYKAVNFPLTWNFCKALIDNVSCVDTNIFYYNNKFWLFTCIEKNSSKNTELYIYYSDNLLEGWKEHSKNPVISDIKNARPAGNVFIFNGNIIRPSQNCENHYGYALNFNVIKELNESTYIEEKIDTILPNWKKNNLCNHTFNFNEDFELIDGLRLQVDILKPFRKYMQRRYKCMR